MAIGGVLSIALIVTDIAASSTKLQISIQARLAIIVLMNLWTVMIASLIVLGWLSGALVNYVADVLPQDRRLTQPRCSNCQVRVSWSRYLLPYWRCPTCAKGRTWRFWIVALVYIGAAIWSWYSPYAAIDFLLGYPLLVYFGVIVVIDIEHRLIMHPVSLFGGLLGLLLGTYLHGFWATVAGGLAGFGIMFGLYLFGVLFGKWMARTRDDEIDEEALGFGDVNLGGVLGLVLGWPGILPGLVFSVIIGGLVSLIYLIGMMILRRYRSFTAIPYGPFLIAGAVTLLYFRDLFLP